MDPTAPEVSTPINCTHCGKPQVKPNTVLYGSQLPSRFFECLKLDFPNHVDLLIVAGTSLTVSPANELPVHVNPSTPRFIVNREKVGRELGIYYGDESKRDIYSNLDCDIVFLYLAHKLGWVEDLKEHIEKMAPESQRLILEYEKTKQVPGFVQVNKM